MTAKLRPVKRKAKKIAWPDDGKTQPWAMFGEAGQLKKSNNNGVTEG